MGAVSPRSCHTGARREDLECFTTKKDCVFEKVGLPQATIAQCICVPKYHTDLLQYVQAMSVESMFFKNCLQGARGGLGVTICHSQDPDVSRTHWSTAGCACDMQETMSIRPSEVSCGAPAGDEQSERARSGPAQSRHAGLGASRQAVWLV